MKSFVSFEELEALGDAIIESYIQRAGDQNLRLVFLAIASRSAGELSELKIKSKFSLVGSDQPVPPVSYLVT